MFYINLKIFLHFFLLMSTTTLVKNSILNYIIFKKKLRLKYYHFKMFIRTEGKFNHIKITASHVVFESYLLVARNQKLIM